MKTLKPTAADLRAAHGKRLRDVIAPRLKILFVGINPGLYSAVVGRHFGRPGNRFWPALHRAGLTPRLLAPSEQGELLKYGYGITNIVNRATAGADELSPKELAAGGRRLQAKVRRQRPRVVAFLGIGAYRMAFGRPGAVAGPQAQKLGDAAVWVLPNPSGRTAGYQLEDLAKLFRRLLANK